MKSTSISCTSFIRLFESSCMLFVYIIDIYLKRLTVKGQQVTYYPNFTIFPLKLELKNTRLPSPSPVYMNECYGLDLKMKLLMQT